MRKSTCPGCKREIYVRSPKCMCSFCLTRWEIEWETTPEEFWSVNSTPKAKKFIQSKAEAMGVDAKALHILFNTQWNLNGREGEWVGYHKVSEADLKHAEKHKLMRPPFEITHRSMMTRVIRARDRLDREAVASAFVASLVNRRMDWRSALGSLAHALHAESHRFRPDKNGDECLECAVGKTQTVSPNANLFRKIMWAGNVLQGRFDYILCDLETFQDQEIELSKEDHQTLRKLLQVLKNLPKKSGLGELVKSVTPVFKGNKHERQVVLEILGYCGILKPAEFPSPHEVWVPKTDYPQPKHFFRKEWMSPVSCWEGKDGVNMEAVDFWFGHIV